MITRIIPPAIHVQDLQAAENQFRTVFGMEVHERSELQDGEGIVSHLICPDSKVPLKLLRLSASIDASDAQRADLEEMRRLTIFTDDFTGDVDRFVANGAVFVETPCGSTSRASYTSFVGPEGYTIEVIAYRPGDKKLKRSLER